MRDLGLRKFKLALHADHVNVFTMLPPLALQKEKFAFHANSLTILLLFVVTTIIEVEVETTHKTL